MTVLQLGQVAVSSRRRASARRWVKQPAHIKWPLVHCKTIAGRRQSPTGLQVCVARSSWAPALVRSIPCKGRDYNHSDYTQSLPHTQPGTTLRGTYRTIVACGITIGKHQCTQSHKQKQQSSGWDGPQNIVTTTTWQLGSCCVKTHRRRVQLPVDCLKAVRLQPC